MYIVSQIRYEPDHVVSKSDPLTGLNNTIIVDGICMCLVVAKVGTDMLHIIDVHLTSSE